MKYVFVDIDGTIAEIGYQSGKIDGAYEIGDYINKSPIESVIAEICNSYNDTKEYEVFVISAAPNTKAILEKNIWLNKYFYVPYENRIYINNSENKIDVIDFFLRHIKCVEPKDNAILIDDKKEWLVGGKEIGLEVYHPTTIIAMFQKRMAELRAQENVEKVEEKESEE